MGAVGPPAPKVFAAIKQVYEVALDLLLVIVQTNFPLFIFLAQRKRGGSGAVGQWGSGAVGQWGSGAVGPPTPNVFCSY